jgi:phosphate-selective porin OprO and OprP
MKRVKGAGVALAGWTLSMLAGAVSTAHATPEQAESPRGEQETQDERLKRVEEQLKRQQDKIDEQQRKIDELQRRTTSKKGFTLGASFTEGFHLMDDEANFDMHLGGRVILHYRDVFGLPHSFSNGPGTPPAFFARTQPDTFYINSAYLIMEGTVYRNWGYRVTGEVSTSSAGASARTETTFVEWKQFPQFSIRGGSFKSPISPDTIFSPLYLDEIERSMFAQFVPNFELGLMVHGTFWDEVLTYQAAVTNGRSYLAGQGRARNDDDGAKEGIGRVTLAPFLPESDHVLRRLRVGLAGTVGSADDVPMQTNFSLASTELAVTWMIPNTGSFLEGRRIRGAAEVSWSWGPVSFRTEGLYRSDEVTRPSAGVDERLLVKAWYAQAGVVLTGEDKVLDKPVLPARPFDPGAGDWGAVELVARVASASVERGTLLALATDLGSQTNRMQSVTVGLNWWPAPNVRVSIDGIREEYAGGIVFMPGGNRESHLYGMLVRFQTNF